MISLKNISPSQLLLLLLTTASTSLISNGFIIPTSYNRITTIRSPQSTKNERKSGHALYAVVSNIDDWQLKKTGEIIGYAVNHPSIKNGKKIETSVLVDINAVGEGNIVTTGSGSKYKLMKENAASAKRNAQKKAKETTPVKKAPTLFSLGNTKKVAAAPTTPQKAPSSKSATEKNRSAVNNSRNNLRKSAITSLKLNGKSVGNGKYLLAGKPIRTTSGKSQLWTAYRSDKNGNPTGQRLKVKMSANEEALSREGKNYDKITTGIFFGKFVKKTEYMPNAGGAGFEKLSALVIEAGYQDLRDLLKSKWGGGLDGKAMRDVAAAAAQCIQAVHASRLVWTDLKTENFVVMSDADGSGGLKSDVKGIDLESCIPIGQNPVTYSPEACPPEFAVALSSGEGADFVLDPSYDIWSFGIMIYEVSTGVPYFRGKTPTTLLRDPNFVADLRKVKDDKLKDMISQCLAVDPKKRPNITKLLLHPYFVTTGFGVFTFLK